MIRTAAMFLVGFVALVATSSASMPTVESPADRNAPTVFRSAGAESDSNESNLIAHRHRKSKKAQHKKHHHRQHHNANKNRGAQKKR